VTNLPNGKLTTENGMSPSWRELALKLRGVLEAAYIKVDDCLPGEPGYCGADYAHHALSYAAAITAFGQETLQHLHHDDPKIKAGTDGLVEHWQTLFASQGEACDHCPKPPVPEGAWPASSEQQAGD
jgi:hypothetical protein